MIVRDRQRGFTLIEIGVVLALLALVVAVAVPSFNAVTAAGLRTSSARIAGMVREAYTRAAITGKVHRIVLDLDKGAYWIERTDDRFVLPSEKLRADKEGRGGKATEDGQDLASQGVQKRVQALSGGAGVSNEALALLGFGGGVDSLPGLMGGGFGASSLTAGFGADQDLEKSLKAQLRRRASFRPVDDETGRPQKLEGDVRFLRVWTEHQQDAFVSGSGELYFFATGYTERAFITLTDDEHGDRTLTVKVNPLTARCAITAEDVEVPR